MEKQIQISYTLTTQEADVLINLIDVAVKAQGLRVAGDATVLYQKLVAAYNEAKAKAEAPAAPAA